MTRVPEVPEVPTVPTVREWKLLVVQAFRARGAEVPAPAVVDELMQHLDEVWRVAIAGGKSVEEAKDEIRK